MVQAREGRSVGLDRSTAPALCKSLLFLPRRSTKVVVTTVGKYSTRSPGKQQRDQQEATISGHTYEHKQVQVLSRLPEHPQVREKAPVWTLKLAYL